MKEVKRKTHIIAHRGASGYIPEHSLAAYLLAVNLGADYIEPDLVLSKDGIFYALHDLLLDDTTNIQDFPQFFDRARTGMVEGKEYTGYFFSDFDSQELKLLRLKQRLPATRSQVSDNLYEIPTLTEIFSLADNLSSTSGNKIGLYIELKHPLYYKDIGYNMEDMILKSLTNANHSIKNVNRSLDTISPIVLQCFIPETLVSLRSKCDLPLVQLMGLSGAQTASDVWNDRTLDLISEYANGVGPPLTFFTDSTIGNIDFNGNNGYNGYNGYNGDNGFNAAVSMISLAKTRNLAVHPYVLKADQELMSLTFNKNSTKETLYFICCLEIDGIFTDYPDRTKLAIELTFYDPTICSDICPSKFIGKMGGEMSFKDSVFALFSSFESVVFLVVVASILYQFVRRRAVVSKKTA